MNLLHNIIVVKTTYAVCEPVASRSHSALQTIARITHLHAINKATINKNNLMLRFIVVRKIVFNLHQKKRVKPGFLTGTESKIGDLRFVLQFGNTYVVKL